MKKYFVEALMLSIVIGICIRILALLITNQPLLVNVEGYLVSIGIAVMSCALSIILHVKVLTNQRYSFLTKALVSSLLILLIYVTGNLYFGGIEVMYGFAFYAYGAVILLISLPLLYRLNSKIRQYNKFLHAKQKQRRDYL
ncbi:hypothetical protein ACFFGV_08590 [Pontibacillus salicampi]|uniref:DUF3021 domain-containing protein n=1 Tax=Pontibacillus salicampi TaxID=1449801 RepID=A0ABV6LMN1_9BACI